MIFDVVKATQGISKWGDQKGTRSLRFEVIPQDRYQLDIGEEYVLIGDGYHAFKATDRRPVVTTVSVATDPSVANRIKSEEPVCGSAHFFKERPDILDPEPAHLAISIAVEPEIFDAMERVQIREPGAATIQVSIEDLEFGPAPDGSHQVWKLVEKEDSRKPVSDFWFNVDKFWTSRQGIWEAEERQTNAWFAESVDPEDRKLAIQPKEPDQVADLLRQCRTLLVSLFVLGAIALYRLS